MKKVLLKTFETTKEYLQEVEEGKPPVKKPMKLKYADLMLQILGATPQEGFDLLAMKMRLNVIGKIEKAVEKEAKSVSFEDAEFSVVKKLVNEHKFAILDQGIVDFIEHIDEVAKAE